MPDHTVTLLRPRPASGYTDTAALNDIHAILTATGTGGGALADITQILVLTGRPMVAAVDNEACCTALLRPGAETV
jgi:hypothetical protein